MATIKLNNNSIITFSKIPNVNDKINIEYKDSNNITYVTEYDLDDIKEQFNKKTLDEFITFVKDNKQKIIIKGINDGEMTLKIVNVEIVLKQKENKTSGFDGITDFLKNGENMNYEREEFEEFSIHKKPNKGYSTDSPAPLAGIDTILAEMKKKYEDKIKEAKAINEEYKKKNIKLKKSIEEEKRKNDEIIRIYLINRQKYEEAVQRNTKIRELEQKI